jgi:hypothetical protein
MPTISVGINATLRFLCHEFSIAVTDMNAGLRVGQSGRNQFMPARRDVTETIAAGTGPAATS